jgi:hypothetical protein
MVIRVHIMHGAFFTSSAISLFSLQQQDALGFLRLCVEGSQSGISEPTLEVEKTNAGK